MRAVLQALRDDARAITACRPSRTPSSGTCGTSSPRLKMVYLFLAYWQERPIAGIIFLRHNDCLYALSNSSDRRFLDKKPNHLLWWRGIQLAVEPGPDGPRLRKDIPGQQGSEVLQEEMGDQGDRDKPLQARDGNRTGTSGRAGAHFEKVVPAVLRKFPSWALRLIGNIATVIAGHNSRLDRRKCDRSCRCRAVRLKRWTMEERWISHAVKR